MALQGRLWGPALVLGHAMGEASFREATAAMTAASFAPASPLSTLCLLHGGCQDLILGAVPGVNGLAEAVSICTGLATGKCCLLKRFLWPADTSTRATQLCLQISVLSRQLLSLILPAGEVPKAKSKAAAHAAPEPAAEPLPQAAEVLSNWQQQATALSNAGTPHSKAILGRLGDLLQQQHQVRMVLETASGHEQQHACDMHAWTQHPASCH